MKLILTYIKSLIERVRYMFEEGTIEITVPTKVFRERLRICKECEHAENNGTYVCGICECPLAKKCRLASEECAKTKYKKWFKWRAPDEEE